MSITRSRRLKKRGGSKKVFFKQKGRKCLRRKSKRRRSRRKNKRRSRRRQRGGYGTGAGPLGYSYVGSNVSTWPGARAAAGMNSNGRTQANYYPLSKNAVGPGGNDPFFGNQSGGSGRSTIIPQDIVNFGRDIIAGPTKLLMDWQGQKMPVSHQPNVTNQPIDKDIKYLYSDPPDIKAIHTAAGKEVANI